LVLLSDEDGYLNDDDDDSHDELDINTNDSDLQSNQEGDEASEKSTILFSNSESGGPTLPPSTLQPFVGTLPGLAGATVSPEPQADTLLCRKRISGPNVTPAGPGSNSPDDDVDEDGPPPPLPQPPPLPPLLPFLLRLKPPLIPNSGNNDAAAAVDPPPRCIPRSASVASGFRPS
jgi:hypothetical protein